MQHNIRYTILSEIEVIADYYSGIITIEDIKRHNIRIHADPLYKDNFNILIDTRDSVLEFGHADIITYIEQAIENKRYTNTRRMVFLTNTPAQVALTTLFKLHTAKLPIQVEVVNGLSAAVRWLGFQPSVMDKVSTSLHWLKNTVIV